MLAKTPLDQFLDQACTEIERRAAATEQVPGVLNAGASAFRSALHAATPLSPERTTVSVTQHLGQLEQSSLALAMQHAAPELAWTASPRTTDCGTEVALAPINLVRELGALTCGLMLLAPTAVYPEHSHPPQEIYLLLAGHGRWRYGGDSNFRMFPEGGLVYNHPGDVHSVVADDQPLLALYILWP